VGTLRETGLSDHEAQGVVCVDVVVGSADWAAALKEMSRVLAPGARAVVTRTTHRGRDSAWRQQVNEAGLEIEHVDERPEEPRMWRNLYHLWISREADLRRALGDTQAGVLLNEARQMLPRLDKHRAYLATLRHAA
jgi:ubiquinone/menaquinone biosynthesis C-methylase UbiE